MSNLTTLNPNYPVERSRLLDTFNFAEYTPDEMLLLDVYLSKINPADPGTRRVQFRKKEYELFLERGKQKTNAFKKASLGLFSKFIDPDHLPEDIEFDPRHVWKELSFKKDKNTNEWVFTMECDPQTEPFFFNTQKYGFIRYLVGYTKNFSSRYSFILYYFLKRKHQEELRYGNPINPTVTELKKLTGTGGKKTFKEFKYFKRDVIDKALGEINCFTDIEVTYETIKIGRKIERVLFNVIEKTTRPLLRDIDTEPSEELKELFAEEIAEIKKLSQPALPERAQKTIDFDDAPEGQTTIDDFINPAAATEGGASDLTQQPEEDEPTDFEKSLFVVIPKEVHKGEVERVRGILNIASKYFSENFMEFYEEGKSYADAMRECADDYNERILDAISSFNVQEYEVRKKGIRNPDAHYAYYKVALEGWLMSHI